MTRAGLVSFVSLLAASPLSAATDPPMAADQAMKQALKDAEQNHSCSNTDPGEVIVCAPSRQHFRIDPSVLAASRALQAPARTSRDGQPDEPCVGPNCGGAPIPLVGMALATIEAVTLALKGDDWREAFRTRPDEYRAFEEAQAKEKRTGSISFGLSAGN